MGISEPTKLWHVILKNAEIPSTLILGTILLSFMRNEKHVFCGCSSLEAKTHKDGKIYTKTNWNEKIHIQEML